jgi:hypothetical protein
MMPIVAVLIPPYPSFKRWVELYDLRGAIESIDVIFEMKWYLLIGAKIVEKRIPSRDSKVSTRQRYLITTDP